MIRLVGIMMMFIWTFIAVVEGWVVNHHPYKAMTTRIITKQRKSPFVSSSSLSMSAETAPKTATSAGATSSTAAASPSYDYVVPDDAVVHIKPMAMSRLRELREQQAKSGSSASDDYLILRMGVRSGGCSGMSYVMDFTTRDLIHAEDDVVDTYEQDRIQCVVDSKSMLYLYGLQLDYSTELIGGGFKFYNPNAEESCGCGSSFGV